MPRSARRGPLFIALVALALLAACGFGIARAHADDAEGTPPEPPTCGPDAMLVFDGSGSMAGRDHLGIGNAFMRIERVRKALGQVLPAVAPHRRLGLITYGPGPYNRCDNIELRLRPERNAAGRIQATVDAIVPAGRTPLTAAVRQAADVLEYRTRPGVVVLLTDGEETCGGNPCALAKRLKAQSADLTIHVIGYRMMDFSWTGGGLLDVKCLASETGGSYLGVETADELIAALAKTLGCPELTGPGGPQPVQFAAYDAPACPLPRQR